MKIYRGFAAQGWFVYPVNLTFSRQATDIESVPDSSSINSQLVLVVASRHSRQVNIYLLDYQQYGND